MDIPNSREDFYSRLGKRNSMATSSVAEFKDPAGFFEMDYEIDMDSVYTLKGAYRSSLPKLKFTPIRMEPTNQKPKGSIRSGCQIFGLPEKMACLSFSLPAGPLDYYGTCPASGYNINDPMFICNGCYALGGNYIRIPNPPLKQMFIYAWTEQAVAEGTFVEQMSIALDHAFSIPKKSKIKKKTITEGANKGLTYKVDYSTTEFFRIHDSGDFFSKDYLIDWCHIAQNFPNTLFWAPTRVVMSRSNKVNKSWADIMRDAPKNLVIRPSSLFFEKKPPMIKGLAAGSTASVKVKKGIKTCPAYLSDDIRHTCDRVGCRTCWDEPRKRVSYPVHGKLAGAIYKKLGIKGVKMNPELLIINPALTVSDVDFEPDLIGLD